MEQFEASLKKGREVLQKTTDDRLLNTKRRMLAAGEDCDSLLVQASAVRSALNGVLISLMEAHVDSCVIPCSKSGKNAMAIERFRRALETVLKRS